jgi:hypothetical protein
MSPTTQAYALLVLAFALLWLCLFSTAYAFWLQTGSLDRSTDATSLSSVVRYFCPGVDAVHYDNQRPLGRELRRVLASYVYSDV